MAGVYLNPNLWLTDQGDIYALVNNGGGGDLGAINWEKIGEYGSGIFDKIIQFKQAGKTPTPAPMPVQSLPSGGGMSVGGGLFGMDTTTILLIALAGFLFMSMPSKK